MTQALGVVGFVLVELIAIVMVPFGLPGTWLQVVVAGVLVWIAPDPTLPFFLGIVVAFALAGEVAEFLSGQWGARRFGGSRRAAWGALIGGFAGLFIGTPVPVVGSLVMSFVGTFVGAIVGEMWGRRDLAPSMRAGVGAVVGRAIGIGLKLGTAFAIAIVSSAKLFYMATGATQ